MYAGAVVGRCAFGQIGTIHNFRTGQPFRFSECSILNIRNGTFFRVPRESLWFILEVRHEQVESGAVPDSRLGCRRSGSRIRCPELAGRIRRSSQEGGPTSQRRRCLSIRLFNRTEATRIRVLACFDPSWPNLIFCGGLICESPGPNRRFAIFVIACQDFPHCEGKLPWARFCRLSQGPEPSLTT